MAKKRKKITGFVKLQIQAGAATPAPPVGTALGPRGLNIQEFCKEFNARTEGEEKGVPLPVVVTCYEDRSFSVEIKKPPMSELIKKALGLEKGSGAPHTDKVGRLTAEQMAEIAQVKFPDLNTTDPAAAARMVAGSARSMGVDADLADLAESPATAPAAAAATTAPAATGGVGAQ